MTTQYNHTTTQADIKGTWTDVAVGGRYGINANNSLYADISTGLSGTYKQSWAVNAGFTHRFEAVRLAELIHISLKNLIKFIFSLLPSNTLILYNLYMNEIIMKMS